MPSKQVDRTSQSPRLRSRAPRRVRFSTEIRRLSLEIPDHDSPLAVRVHLVRGPTILFL